MTKECSYAAATTAVPGDQKCGKSEASVPKNERQTSSSSLRAKSVGLIAVIFYAVVTAAVSFYLYFIVSESEENGLQVQFDADASIVLDSIEDITITKLEALSSLAVAFTSQAIANNNTWPFVTLNSFHERAASVRSISGALFLEILPVVSDEDRAEWEAYSVQRLGWVGGGRAYEAQQAKDDAGRSRERVLNGGDTQLQQGSDDIFPRPPSPTIPVEGPPLEFAAGSSNRIYAIDKNLAPYVDPGPGYYVPMWQSSPVWDINLVNFNFLCFQDQTPGVVTALERGQIAIGRMDLVDARDVIRPSFAGRTSTLIEKRAADQNSGNSFSSEAQDRLQSTFFFPVFDTHHTATRKPVAVLLAIMDWATLLEISPHWDGLVIVLATDCGESYSYKVDGEKLRFLGKGDLHNNKYDSFERSVTLDYFIGARLFRELGLVVNQDWCGYSFRVYPSDELYGLSTTNIPLVVALSCAGVSLFTAATYYIISRSMMGSRSVALEKCDDGNVGASSKQPAEAYERQQFVLDDHSCASATEDMTFAKSSCSHSLDYDDSGTLSATPVRSKKLPITTLSLVQQILQQQEEKQQAARKIARSTLTHGLQPPNATNHCAI